MIVEPKVQGAPPKDEKPKEAEKIQTFAAKMQFRSDFPAPKQKGFEKANQVVFGIYLSDDGKRVAIHNQGIIVKSQVWDIANQPKKIRDIDGKIRAMSPNGRRVLVREFGGSVSNVFDVDTEQTIEKEIIGVGFFRQPDGPMSYYCTELEGKFTVFQLGNDKIEQVASMNQPAELEIQVLPRFVRNPFEIFINKGDANSVKVWNGMGVLTREVRLASPMGKILSVLTISPDGKRFAVSNDRDPARIFDGMTGAAIGEIPAKLISQYSAFVPDQNLLISSKKRSYAIAPDILHDIIVHDYSRDRIPFAFVGHSDPIESMAISANREVMATGDAGGKIMIWDLKELKKE